MASKNSGHSRRRCCNCHETSVELCDSLCGWETWHSSKKFQGKVPQKCLQKPAFFWHIFTQKKKIQKEDIKKSMSLEAKLFPWSYPYCFAVSMKATLEEVIQWDLKWLEEYVFFLLLFLWFLLLYLLVLIAICFRDLWYFWIAAVHLNGRQLRWTIHKKSTLDTMRATASSWKLANWNTGRFCSLPSLEKHENTLTVLEIVASAQI